jgi:hypothetical protein
MPVFDNCLVQKHGTFDKDWKDCQCRGRRLTLKQGLETKKEAENRVVEHSV